jgi:hypothetical protein
MSELINRYRTTQWKWRLLATVSTLALSGSLPAAAKSDESPSIWIEVGGQLEKSDRAGADFTPDFVANAAVPNGFTPVTDIDRDPRYFSGFEGRISIVPGDGWSFSAALRYGRSNRDRYVHEQTAPPTIKVIQSIPALDRYSVEYIQPVSDRFLDTASHRNSSYAIVDFEAGRDVGVGLFRGALNLGVRFAQFTSKSAVAIAANPDFSIYYTQRTQHRYFPPLGRTITLYSQDPHQKWHLYDADARSERSFRGVGPSLSWSSSVPLAGNSEGGAIMFDWGINGALLFGRQKAIVHHQTTARYRSAHNFSAPTTVYRHATDHLRSRSVIVPNIGGFAGLSFRYSDAKIKLGYRADFFFGAMDGGIDTRKTYDRNFYGPFATLSIGLGG